MFRKKEETFFPSLNHDVSRLSTQKGKEKPIFFHHHHILLVIPGIHLPNFSLFSYQNDALFGSYGFASNSGIFSAIPTLLDDDDSFSPSAIQCICVIYNKQMSRSGVFGEKNRAFVTSSAVVDSICCSPSIFFPGFRPRQMHNTHALKYTVTHIKRG